MTALIRAWVETMAANISGLHGLQRERVLRGMEGHIEKCAIKSCFSCDVYRLVFATVDVLDRIRRAG